MTLTTVDSSQPGGNRGIDTCLVYEKNIDLQQSGNGPCHQDKTSLDSRLATFKNWPRSMKQRPAELAEAGFYYTGVADQVVCFHCGGGLEDWGESDDPWRVHARWYDKCVYLNLKKGTHFVENIQRKGYPQLSLPRTSDEKNKEAVGPKEPSSETPEKVEKNTETKPSKSTLCKICFQNKLDALFLPCSHIFACVDCASALKTCPVCGKPVEATSRVYIFI